MIKHKTMKVKQLTSFKIDDTIKDAVNDIQWRIESNNFKELFIEVCNEIIEGIAISWTNAFHPTAKYISIISTDYNHQLMENLLEQIAPQNKVIFSCWENEKDKLRYIDKFSFTLFRRTFMESYSIDYLINRLQLIDEEPTILTLQQVLSNSPLEKNLFQLLKHNYEQTHLDNEANDIPWDKWREVLLRDNPDPQISHIAVENDCVTAYIFVHQVNNEHYEIGWMGKSSSFNLHTILSKQLKQLAANGVKTVEFEVDTTDYFAYEFADTLELDKKQSWNSYVLNY